MKKINYLLNYVSSPLNMRIIKSFDKRICITFLTDNGSLTITFMQGIGYHLLSSVCPMSVYLEFAYVCMYLFVYVYTYVCIYTYECFRKRFLLVYASLIL